MYIYIIYYIYYYKNTWQFSIRWIAGQVITSDPPWGRQSRTCRESPEVVLGTCLGCFWVVFCGYPWRIVEVFLVGQRWVVIGCSFRMRGFLRKNGLGIRWYSFFFQAGLRTAVPRNDLVEQQMFGWVPLSGTGVPTQIARRKKAIGDHPHCHQHLDRRRRQEPFSCQIRSESGPPEFLLCHMSMASFGILRSMTTSCDL